MKLTTLFCKSFVFTLFLALSCTVINAQSRYKHLPRVKIKKTNVETLTVDQEQSSVTKSEIKNDTREVQKTAVETKLMKEAETTPVSFAEKTIAHTPVKKRIARPATNENIRSTFAYTPTVHRKLQKPETTQKTNVSVAIILLIVFYILAAIFTVLCILYLYLFANFTMFLVFLILAIVFGLAGSVLSILLKFGVVN